MSRSRVTISEPRRIYISDGDWIEVKANLTNGDQKRLESAGLTRPIVDGNSGRILYPVDWEVHDLERAMVFLVDWSLKDDKDKPIKLGMDGLKAIDPDTFDEINNAILQHALWMARTKKAAREEREAAATKAASLTNAEEKTLESPMPSPPANAPTAEPLSS